MQRKAGAKVIQLDVPGLAFKCSSVGCVVTWFDNWSRDDKQILKKMIDARIEIVSS